MKICKECGKQSRMGGLCWDKYNKCASCSKKYYKKPMTLTCKRCPNTSNHVGGLCWRLYGICGECYRKEMSPRKYNRNKICKKCSGYLIRSYSNKGGNWINLPYRVCTTCHTIYVENHNWKIEPME